MAADSDTKANANPPAAAGKKVPVRVLTQCEHGAPNDVAELDAALIKEAKAAGLVDDAAAAVAYARSIAAGRG